jgi:hypothetical protein
VSLFNEICDALRLCETETEIIEASDKYRAQVMEMHKKDKTGRAIIIINLKKHKLEQIRGRR